MRSSRLARVGLVIALATSSAGTAACGEPQPELREWQPSDHQQPSAADPSATDRAVAPPEEASPEETEVRAATALFRSMCASCHGESGRGDGPGRPPVAQVADLTTAAWQSSRTDEAIAEVIREGRGGFMPGFGDRLSPAGVEALVRHVRRLGGAAPTDGAAEAAPTEAAPTEAAPTEAAPTEAAPAAAPDPAPAGAAASRETAPQAP